MSDEDVSIYTPNTDEGDDEDDVRSDREPIAVGIAEYALTDRRRPLSTSGLGSCVAVAVHDADAGVSGLLHFMLPQATESKGRHDAEAKFADTGIESLLAEFEEYGGEPSRSWAKLAGGASMIEFSRSERSIGERNAAAATATLTDRGVSIVGTDFGGHSGRSVVFSPETGELIVKSASGEENRL